MALVLLLAVAVIPLDCVRRERVDLVGINHVYDEFGRRIGDYVNFWRVVHRYPFCEHLTCQAWRDLDNTGRPWRSAKREWRLIWFDRDGALRDVRGAAFRETWTQYDREVEDRARFPCELRGGLLP